MSWTNHHPDPDHKALLEANHVMLRQPNGYETIVRAIALTYEPMALVVMPDGTRDWVNLDKLKGFTAEEEYLVDIAMRDALRAREHEDG